MTFFFPWLWPRFSKIPWQFPDFRGQNQIPWLLPDFPEFQIEWSPGHNICNFYWNFWWENFSCWRGIVIKSCFSYMQDFWICQWQEKYKEFQHYLPIHENCTFYTFYTSSFFTLLPQLLKLVTNLFFHTRKWRKNSY